MKSLNINFLKKIFNKDNVILASLIAIVVFIFNNSSNLYKIDKLIENTKKSI